MTSYGICLSDLVHLVHPCCCKWQYFILFYAWVVLYCIYVPHLLYPFLCWGMFWLFPCLGYCKWYYYEYWGTCIFSDYSFLWVYAQEWIFNVNSYVKVTFKLRQIIRFLDWRTWQQFARTYSSLALSWHDFNKKYLSIVTAGSVDIWGYIYAPSETKNGTLFYSCVTLEYIYGGRH